MTKIQIGDKVAYSAKFLKSTGQLTGAIPHARGTVTEVKTCGSMELATITWGNPDIPERVNVFNLARIGTPAMNSN